MVKPLDIVPLKMLPKDSQLDSRMLEIDGSYGEGGGQILRTSLALASVLGKAIRVTRIRAGRPRPGLMAQHLTGVNATAMLCDAEVSGAVVGSEELSFRPGNIQSGAFRFDVGTAGSVTLVLQALMPVLSFAPGPVELEIVGGTDVKWSPPVDYLSLVALPILATLGYNGRLELVRRGHYPRGGGMIRFRSEPSNGGYRALTGPTQGKVAETRIVSHAVKLPTHVAQRQAESASEVLRSNGLPNPKVRLDTATDGSSAGPGSGILVAAETDAGAVLAGDGLGDRGVPAELVGKDAATRLVQDLQSKAFLDRHMADIIVPFLALAHGESDVLISRVTRHVSTNIEVAQSLSGVRFHLDGDTDQPGRLRVEGCRKE